MSTRGRRLFRRADNAVRTESHRVEADGGPLVEVVERPAPVGGVGVVDGVGGSVAGRVVLALDAASARAVPPTGITAGFDCVVVLLPLRVSTSVRETEDVLSVLASAATDPAIAAGFSSGVVVVWCAAGQDRASLAAPRVTSGASNSANLFLGTSWLRERVLHRGDERAAVRCRDDAVRRMIHTSTHRSLSGVLLPDVCRQLTLLDPGCLHTLAVRLEDGPRHAWSGAAGIAAAVRLRLEERRAEPA